MFWLVVSVTGFAVETSVVVLLGRSVTRPYEEAMGLDRPSATPRRVWSRLPAAPR